MNIKYAGHYARKIKPAVGAYYKYVLTLSDGPEKGINQPRWRGVRVSKLPNDLILYAEAIFENRPNVIIETGTRFGGSALFFSDVMMASGGKRVITIDTELRERLSHPLIRYITGSSTDPVIYKVIKESIKGYERVMVSLDSDHSTKHVLKELSLYSKLVTVGQYLVVEDSWHYAPDPSGPYHAIQEFLSTHTEFERVPREKKYLMAVTRDGWLKRLS